MKKKELRRELEALIAHCANQKWLMRRAQDENLEHVTLLTRIAACEAGSVPLEEAIHEVRVHLGMAMPNRPMIRD